MRPRSRASQLFLKARSWLRTSWLWSWWEKYVYLVGRDPIMINSNYYVLDSCWYSVTTNQVLGWPPPARARRRPSSGAH